MTDVRPGYYAVIPADVRYDDSIPANAKLLYGEISALIGAQGYCYATNAYFMKIYGFSDPTVTRLITKLEKAGYIKRVIERDSAGLVSQRKIYLSVSMPEIHPPVIFDTPSHQDQWEGGIKNNGYTNLSNTSNIPPISPPEGGDPPADPPKKPKPRKRESKGTADILPERFEKFWVFYREHVPDGVSAGNRQKAIRAWDKLAPDAALVDTLAAALFKQVKSQAWKSGIGVPHASTWLNNRGWEDDWGASADSVRAQSSGLDGEESAEWVY